MSNHPTYPFQCYACKRLFLPTDSIINHHITYFPEKVVNVHPRCHALIHKSKTKFKELRPDPRQVWRWYKKKGVTFTTHRTYANQWHITTYFNSLENGFVTQEILIDSYNEFWKEHAYNRRNWIERV